MLMIKKVFMLALVTTTIIIGAPGDDEEPSQLEQLQKNHYEDWKETFQNVMPGYEQDCYLPNAPEYIASIVTNLRSKTEQKDFDKLSGCYPMLAARKGHAQVVEAFLKSGINPFTPCKMRYRGMNMREVCKIWLKNSLEVDGKKLSSQLRLSQEELEEREWHFQHRSQTDNYVKILLIIQEYEIKWQGKSQNQIKDTKNSC